MRTLLIDHRDSYTYNLVDILAEINGEPPSVLSLDSSLPDDFAFDNIVLSPGPGTPYCTSDLGITSEVLQVASSRRIPVLGVCLGHQALCVMVGKQVAKRTPAHGRISRVDLTAEGKKDPILRGVLSSFNVVRYHSLGANMEPCERIVPLAHTSDLLQIFRVQDKSMWGVQFHPESILTAHGVQILRNFCALSSTNSYHAASPSIPRPMTSTREHADIPMVKWRHLAGAFDVESIFALFGEDAFWLDGCRSAAHMSFLGGGALAGEHAFELSYFMKTRQLIDSRHSTPREVDNFFEFFDTEVENIRARIRNDPRLPFSLQCGGFVGYFGYEMKAQAYRSSDCLFSERGEPASGIPDAYWRFVDRQVAVGADGDLWLVGTGDDWMDAWEKKIWNCAIWEEGPTDVLSEKFIPAKNHDAYVKDIQQCIDHIYDGESYELCLTTQFKCAQTIDARNAYRRLRRQNPAPHGAYIGAPAFQVLSSSPERFLKIHDGWAEVKPIKGTLARGKTPEEDEVNRRTLETDEKCRAENLMIVDLMRNDLATFCIPGTVHCPHLMNVEPHPTMFQLVSTVRGCLQHDVSVVAAVRSCFPAGSMTGAPKVRAMQILERLEKEPRGIYSGSLGWITPAGCDLSVVIRTVVITPKSLHLGAGGAIIALSDPESEWDEMLLKTEAPFRALTNPLIPLPSGRRDFRPPFDLFETVRVEADANGAKVIFAKEHYERLRNSCAFFGIPHPTNEDFMRDILHTANNVTSRVRYCTSGKKTAMALTDCPVWTFAELDARNSQQTLIRVALDSVSSNTDRLTCFHKTTDRAVYDEALARRTLQNIEDVILHNIRGEVTEFSIGNLCLETESGWVTPPLRSGLLLGVMRNHLVATGLLRFRVITVHDLKDAVDNSRRIARINSVRGIQLVTCLNAQSIS